MQDFLTFRLESDWNPLTAEKALENALFGYQASKKFAEKAAWDFIPSRVAEKGITLVTICPPLIFGPVHPASGITIEAPNESSSQLLQAINNAGEPAPTRMPVFADVRDVAKAHIEALDHDRVPGSERFLVCGGKFTWAAVREIAQTGTNSSDIMEPAAGFYTINAEKAESQLGIKWTTLEVCTRILLLA